MCFPKFVFRDSTKVSLTFSSKVDRPDFVWRQRLHHQVGLRNNRLPWSFQDSRRELQISCVRNNLLSTTDRSWPRHDHLGKAKQHGKNWRAGQEVCDVTMTMKFVMWQWTARQTLNFALFSLLFLIV